MTWPATPTFVTTNVDAGTDSPTTARSDLFNLMSDVSNMIAGRGQASGVASLDSGSKLPQAQLPAIVPMPNGIFSDSTPGTRTWTVPAGVTRALVEIWGGGGGGGFTSTGTGGDHGGGGGAGGGAVKLFTGLVAGQVLTYVVGAAGQGGQSGVPDADGTAGGQSSASYVSPSQSITANGGGGGIGGGTRFGGGGGLGAGGDVNLQGGAGASGEARGGMGGANGRCGALAGPVGAFGGGGFGSGSGTSAWNGAPGGIIITW